MNTEKNKNTHTANWMAFGISFGLMFGMLFDNLAIGMMFGLMFGLGIGSFFDEKEKRENESSDD